MTETRTRGRHPCLLIINNVTTYGCSVCSLPFAYSIFNEFEFTGVSLILLVSGFSSVYRKTANASHSLASDEVRKKKIHFWHKQKPPSKTKAMLATSFATRQFIRKAATHGARSASRAFATQSSLFTPRVVRNAGVNHLSNCVLLVF